MATLPDAVLFACNLNRVRSPVAAALLRQRLGARVFVDSCGLKPADSVDPFAAAVMAEVGLDLSGHQPKGFDELEDDSFDLVISLTPEAHHRAGELGRGRAVELEYWPIYDPTLEVGSREQRLTAFRNLRAELGRRLDARFPALQGFGG
ncbi:low molecular weight phosphatase family protein [Caulobacter sp. S45]|uniref:arsenate-mycothiol transferase ArsC n=1 Tax=Caulobacter sp. S45 TaxID=1641861 RepID=UPI001575062A|nr:low molecular weight phosphatase family protein [Caulobacter sp. S45]